MTVDALRTGRLIKCGYSARDSMILGGCLSGLQINTPDGQKVLASVDCLNAAGGRSSMNAAATEGCIKKAVDPAKIGQAQIALDAMRCAEYFKALGSIRLSCLPEPALLSKAQTVVDCAAGADRPFDDRLLRCLGHDMDGKDLERIQCFARNQSRPELIATRCVLQGDIKGVPASEATSMCNEYRAAADKDDLGHAVAGSCNNTCCQASLVELRTTIMQCPRRV